MRTHRKIRIFLLMLAFGLAAVRFFPFLYDKWTEIYVDLPKVESKSPIYIFPAMSSQTELQILPKAGVTKDKKRIIQDRNLSLYDFGGHHSDCGFMLRKELRKCEADKIKARNFIWEHWQNKKRAYIIVTFSSVDARSDAHIFIEPDTNGQLHIVWIWERFDSEYDADQDNLDFVEVSSMKYKRATEDDYEQKTGTYYLSFLDENGEEFVGF